MAKAEDGKGHIYRKVEGGTYYLRKPKSIGGGVVSLKTTSLYEAEKERDKILMPFLAQTKIEQLEIVKAQIASTKLSAADISDKFANCPISTFDDNGKFIKCNFLDLYKTLGSCQKNLSDNTYKKWYYDTRNFCIWLRKRYQEKRIQQKKDLDNGVSYPVYEYKTIKDIDPITASEYISYVQSLGHSDAWNCMIFRLKRIWKEFGRLSDHSYFHKNVWDVVKLSGKHKESHKRNLTPEEIEKVIEGSKIYPKFSNELYLFVMMSLYLGMRKCDTCSLRWDMIQDGFVNLIPKKGKRLGKSFRVAIPKALIKILDEQKQKVDADEKLNQDQKSFVCYNLYHMYKTRYLDELMLDLFKSVGIETTEIIDGIKRQVVSSHSFRHTYISTLAAKVDMERVRKLATHTSDKVTRDVYEHLEDKSLIDAVAVIPDYDKVLGDVNTEDDKTSDTELSKMLCECLGLSQGVMSVSNMTVELINRYNSLRDKLKSLLG